VRFLGDIELAEEAVQDAFTKALVRWPKDGVPPSPAGWIITTARNRAMDHVRREATRDARQSAATQMLEQEAVEEHDVRDERLRLIFTCCHPALAPEVIDRAHAAVAGRTDHHQIAHASWPETTMRKGRPARKRM
jgi:RNA polymerase sigma-70 factor (ECF subfamily)